MRFHHTIEATSNAEDPIWDVVITGDEIEEYDGTSTEYGREVLQNWVDDQDSLYPDTPTPLTDEHGNPYLRCVVRFSDNSDEQNQHAAVVGSDTLDHDTTDIPGELSAVDIARDAKLHAQYLDRTADSLLADALWEAREAGHGANVLARRVEPAVSRPTALRMMRSGS
ncbi:hypothetical protein [Streptomyces sp. NPDC088115]|uniref:hypothetical protein n=1 Tax=Streptomyces sp. NPDC088115 TaxID=3365824 RepID=UPI003825AB19